MSRQKQHNEGYNLDSRLSFNTTENRTQHAHNSTSNIFLSPPEDPTGRRVDVSDRLLICSSTNMRNEVVVGGSDHALYSIDINDPKRQPITMYGKQYGHTDWVTSVAHLADGNVLSASMDGRLCLWSASNRRISTELQRESSHPISKVVTDARYNVAVSCCYDTNISLWSLGGDSDSYAGVETKMSRMNIGSNNAVVSQARPTVLSGHAQPVLECAFNGNILVSGDKGGSLMYWDMTRSQALHRFRAHPAAVTAIDVMEDRNTVITCGTDGFVKIWDPRTAGSGLVNKIPSHVKPEIQPQPSTGGTRKSVGSTVAGRQPAVRTIGGTVSGGGFASESTTGFGGPAVRSAVKPTSSARPTPTTSLAAGGPPTGAPTMVGSAISCMSVIHSRGSGDVNYIITGSGGAQNPSLVLLDARSNYAIVSEWAHHKNGIYSLCVVGDETVFSGDGAGNLLCHSILESNLDHPRDCIKYGLGASEVGAVRAISCVAGKIVTAGEDGKVMIYDYNQITNTRNMYK